MDNIDRIIAANNINPVSAEITSAGAEQLYVGSARKLSHFMSDQVYIMLVSHQHDNGERCFTLVVKTMQEPPGTDSFYAYRSLDYAKEAFFDSVVRYQKM